MSTKTTTTTTDVSVEDIRSVQGIVDDGGGSCGSKTEPVDCQRQRSVDFPLFQVANSNTFLSL